ncbi:hypothetical protein N7519_000993 [Penicillium mononematosum]|uniref:uncharacterized protein n=1 Tax=Penicillium mononematosum TaxID=268346 RepID=UPI0025498D34|nr:uncharacterized protein N7519_000993 [Penicillium mononematosum]KAJ6190972.1 hypothetical protein N7519_000993 [Penicillium mononematosum]
MGAAATTIPEDWMAVGAPKDHNVQHDLVLKMHRCQRYRHKAEYSPGGYDKKELSIRDALVSKQRKVGNVHDDERWMEEGGIESVAFGELVWPLGFEVDHASCMRPVGSDRSASYRVERRQIESLLVRSKPCSMESPFLFTRADTSSDLAPRGS